MNVMEWVYNMAGERNRDVGCWILGDGVNCVNVIRESHGWLLSYYMPRQVR